MAYSILGINPGHNGSAALVVDGVLAFYIEEERLSRQKYDGNPFRAMLHILINHSVDELVIGGTYNEYPVLPWTNEIPYVALARKFNPGIKVTMMGHFHHLGHASAAFYGSGFNTAAAVVIDGAGSQHQDVINEAGQIISGYETETIYHCSYPHEFNAVYKRYSDGSFNVYDNGIQEFDGSVTITKAYEAVSEYLGFGFIEAGKTMGLAPYGKPNNNIPQFFINGKGNRNLLIPLYPAGATINENIFNNLKRFGNPTAWHADESLCAELNYDMAFAIQKETEEQVINLIQKAIDTTGETNIVLSGGYSLNCVANYRFLKEFPNINFYVDPIAHDGGTAIGVALYASHQVSKDIKASKISDVYLGTMPDYNQLSDIMQNVSDLSVEDVSPEEVVDLIIDGNIIALFQGRSEGGPRALGNRSILFDPRNIDGKKIVNTVKNREWFRPFAGSVLEENASEWFDMAGLDSSPYMMYCVKVKDTMVDKIPAITHVDNTCRIQTVNKAQNPHYYELIKVFNDKTGVPILFNTSFNLAGQPLVDSLFDAMFTLYNSQIKYLYLPEIGKLVKRI